MLFCDEIHRQAALLEGLPHNTDSVHMLYNDTVSLQLTFAKSLILSLFACNVRLVTRPKT